MTLISNGTIMIAGLRTSNGIAPTYGLRAASWTGPRRIESAARAGERVAARAGALGRHRCDDLEDRVLDAFVVAREDLHHFGVRDGRDPRLPFQADVVVGDQRDV